MEHVCVWASGLAVTQDTGTVGALLFRTVCREVAEELGCEPTQPHWPTGAMSLCGHMYVAQRTRECSRGRRRCHRVARVLAP